MGDLEWVIKQASGQPMPRQAKPQATAAPVATESKTYVATRRKPQTSKP